MRLKNSYAAGITAVLLGTVLAGARFGSLHPVLAADHRDAPTVDGISEGDITDVFLFTDPTDATRVVFIMNVNPFAVPGENPSYSFSPDLLYQFKIDNTGDAREDLVIQATFDQKGTGQTAQIFGPVTPSVTGARTVLVGGTPTASGKFNTVFGSATGVQAFAGLRDDPFVFDFSQFSRILNGSQDVFRNVGTFRGRTVRADGNSGVDTFGGFNVTSIVVSVPKAMVRGTGSKINVWGTVSQRVPTRHGAQTFDQFERMGQQAFATVFVPKEQRDAFNFEIPEHDVALDSGLVPDALTTTDNDGTGNTIAGRAALLTSLGVTSLPNGAPLLLPASLGNTNKNLLRVALLPDVLRLDLDLPATDLAIGQFGLQNGRKLDYSSIDIALQLLRQLADVHFPSGVPGGGSATGRGALECSAFPACQDRRVLVVVQGTDFTRPDAAITNYGSVGNDRPFPAQFPYAPTPHPFPGDATTTGFPPQK